MSHDFRVCSAEEVWPRNIRRKKAIQRDSWFEETKSKVLRIRLAAWFSEVHRIRSRASQSLSLSWVLYINARTSSVYTLIRRSNSTSDNTRKSEQHGDRQSRSIRCGGAQQERGSLIFSIFCFVLFSFSRICYWRMFYLKEICVGYSLLKLLFCFYGVESSSAVWEGGDCWKAGGCWNHKL